MSTTVFLSNLNFAVEESNIKSFFEQIGNVIEVRIVQNKNSKSKGSAYVIFEKPEEADKACNLFNHQELIGKKIKIEKITKDNMKMIIKQENEPIRHYNPSLDCNFIEKIAISEKQYRDLEKKVDDLKKENKTIMKEINYLRFKDDPTNFFLIPINQIWTVETPFKCSLAYKNVTYTVTVSNICNDHQNHYPYFLFNGKMENENGGRWATTNNQTSAFIIIQSSKEIIYNVIFMCSRDNWYNQSPTSFEIFGIDTSGNHFSLHKYDNIVWKRNEKKYFRFENETYYYTYKIALYSTVTSDIFGLAELNLGYVPT